MFCNGCGSLLRPVDGSMICPKCDSEKFGEMERAQENLIPSWGGLRKRDTVVDMRARRERAIDELTEHLRSMNLYSRKATASELREVFGLTPSATPVIVLKDGRSVSLRTNWVQSREKPRFPLGMKSPVKRFDFVVFALTDNDESTTTEWWIMRPKEVFLHWHLGDEDEFGYLDAEDLSTYHNRWERLQ